MTCADAIRLGDRLFTLALGATVGMFACGGVAPVWLYVGAWLSYFGAALEYSARRQLSEWSNPQCER